MDPASIEALCAACRSADRVPTKSGLVAFPFLPDKERDAIAAEVATAFRMGEKRAAKITRRITGRVRLKEQ